jgi:hypothetical protein
MRGRKKMTIPAFTRKLPTEKAADWRLAPVWGVAEHRRCGARGGDNYGGDSTIRLGNKPPPLIFMKKFLND